MTWFVLTSCSDTLRSCTCFLTSSITAWASSRHCSASSTRAALSSPSFHIARTRFLLTVTELASICPKLRSQPDATNASLLTYKISIFPKIGRTKIKGVKKTSTFAARSNGDGRPNVAVKCRDGSLMKRDSRFSGLESCTLASWCIQ